MALTLRAIAETSGVDDGRATEILGRLGVVSTPSVPLALTTVNTRVPSYAPYLPRLVLDWSRDGGAGVRQLEGTLVSVDLSGFTRLSERLQAKGRAGAEELVLAVSGVFQGLIGITERHDGDVLKFRGDALLLFFHGEGHERRACHTASDMQSADRGDREDR